MNQTLMGSSPKPAGYKFIIDYLVNFIPFVFDQGKERQVIIRV